MPRSTNAAPQGKRGYREIRLRLLPPIIHICLKYSISETFLREKVHKLCGFTVCPPSKNGKPAARRLGFCSVCMRLIFSPLDRRIAEEPFQRFFGFFGKVDIEFGHHADLLP